MIALVVAAALAGFPLPPEHKGEPAAEAKRIVLPFGFERLERFYKQHFAGADGVTVRAEKGEDGARRLVVSSKRKSDGWARAVLTEGEGRSTLEVTPLIRGEEQKVEGAGKPEVKVILQRSSHAKEMADSIEHTPK